VASGSDPIVRGRTPALAAVLGERDPIRYGPHVARTISRLRLMLPAQKAHDARAAATAEALAQRIADALAVSGVQVRQQVQGTPHDGAPRADAALWMPDADGGVAHVDARAAPARVQIALVVDVDAKAQVLARYDALLAPHAAIAHAISATLKRAGGREPPVFTARVPAGPPVQRDAEKALRGVTGRRLAVVDARDHFESEIERIIVQLGLRSQGGAVLLLVPHDDRARGRARLLCERHAVDAWLVSGADGFASAASAIDLFVGQPSWEELLLLALYGVDVAVDPDHAAPLVRALIGARVLDDRHGTLQLAATLDRKLADPGALDARGVALKEALCGPERECLDAIARAEPLPDGARASQWEAVGPHAQKTAGGAPVVEARDPTGPPEPSRAQKIEDQLQALKDKIARERAP
jgi:hypothetical protein